MTDCGDLREANDRTRRAWEANAQFWDDRMGEGNDFVNVLIWPATLRLLGPEPGQRILDIACGNGLHGRRLAALGATVVAIDFSEELLARAGARDEYAEAITYLPIDVTDEGQLLGLADRPFDAAICQMALFDIADINPLMCALPHLLKPGGRFVFTIVHPCFNNNHFRFVAEREDCNGVLVTTYSLNIRGYMTPSTDPGLAMAGQPEPHLYFHRPISEVFNAAFAHGFVLDGMEECAFPADHPQGANPLSWGGNYSEFPPVLAARMVLAG
jgi:SAM-dependent methyltransferase